MGVTLAEVMGTLTEERRDEIERGAAQLIAEVDGLPMLRQVGERNQKERAERLGAAAIAGPSISRREGH